MGVFLRWGVFGILAVAALVYAYNASKKLAQTQPASVQASSGENETAASQESADTGGEAASEPEEALEPACVEELQVAQLALLKRREGEPVDRLMRNDLIAFQSDPRRRQRLENVARQWFDWQGEEPDAATLRSAVKRDCWRFSPAP
jgi:hypothetical protein